MPILTPKEAEALRTGPTFLEWVRANYTTSQGRPAKRPAQPSAQQGGQG